MAAVITFSTEDSVAKVIGRMTRKLVGLFEDRTNSALAVTGEMQILGGARGGSTIRLYDQNNALIAQVHGNPGSPATFRLNPAVAFADNSAGSAMDIDVNPEDYGAPSRLEIDFHGMALTDPEIVGVIYAVEGVSIWAMENNGGVTVEQLFTVATI